MSLTKGDLHKLAEIRIEEAAVLLDCGHFSGAYYLAGYAIECALKAVIAKNFRSDEIPDKRYVEKIHVHDLSRLVDLAGLEASLIERRKSDQRFDANWEFVVAWSEHARYVIFGEEKARNLIQAVRQQDGGILQWIKQHW